MPPFYRESLRSLEATPHKALGAEESPDVFEQLRRGIGRQAIRRTVDASLEKIVEDLKQRRIILSDPNSCPAHDSCRGINLVIRVDFPKRLPPRNKYHGLLRLHARKYRAHPQMTHDEVARSNVGFKLSGCKHSHPSRGSRHVLSGTNLYYDVTDVSRPSPIVHGSGQSIKREH